MHHQLNIWHRTTHQRYGLTTHHKIIFSKASTLNPKETYEKNLKVYLNHPFYWSGQEKHLQKICLHATSGKLHSNGLIYGSFKLALCCASTQAPKLIKSRQSVSAFKLLKAHPLALGKHLRNNVLKSFAYKWTWLSALNLNITGSGQSIGLNDVFIFPELDQLNYYAFSPLPGLEIHFHHNNCVSSRRLKQKTRFNKL